MGMGIVVGRDVLLVDTMAFVTMVSEQHGNMGNCDSESEKPNEMEVWIEWWHFEMQNIERV